MTIINSINRSQSLVQEITSLNSVPEVSSLLLTLTKELTILKSMVKQNQANEIDLKAEMKSGCYIFTNDKNYYCPNCYDNHDMKTATKRMNSKLRVCPSCRASIR